MAKQPKKAPAGNTVPPASPASPAGEKKLKVKGSFIDVIKAAVKPKKKNNEPGK